MRTTVKEYYDKLESAVAALLEKDNVKEFFSGMAKFRRYSFANLLLVMMQRPGATKVAGLTTWNSLGKKSEEGGKGHRHLCPHVQKKGTDSQEEDAGHGSSASRRSTCSTSRKPKVKAFRARNWKGQRISLSLPVSTWKI